MIKKDDTYKIGHVGKTHGLKGELTFTFTDDLFDSVDCPYLICEVEGILVPFFIEQYRFKTDSSAIIKFEGIDSIEQAQQLVGSDVYFEKKYVEEGSRDEVSLNYFIGFTVTDKKEGLIGTITDIDDQTDNWLFVISRQQTGGKKNEVLIPANEEFITDINQEGKNIEMDLPAGLLEL